MCVWISHIERKKNMIMIKLCFLMNLWSQFSCIEVRQWESGRFFAKKMKVNSSHLLITRIRLILIIV